jgi:predicted nucleotidyltransferase
MSLITLTKDLPGALVNFPEISLVYLFGSQVTGQAGPMSDTDLAFLDSSSDEDTTIQTCFQHALALALNNNRIDVIRLRCAPVELAYAVIAGGKLHYQKDNLTRVEYEARVLSQYGDYLPVLRSQREQILRGDGNAKRVERYREALGRTQRTLGSLP